MYLLYNDTKYSCKCRPGETMVYRDLPEDFPAPVEGEISLCADDGFVMRTDNTEDYLRQVFENGTLMLTNAPEPAPAPGEELEAEPTSEELLSILLGVSE